MKILGPSYDIYDLHILKDRIFRKQIKQIKALDSPV